MDEESDVIFLTVSQVEGFHKDQLEKYGGHDGLREPGLLESAVEQAKATYYYGNQSVHEAAAAYLFHIAENQPFVDGNKRTACDAALTFLAVNGSDIEFDEMFPYNLCIAVANKKLAKKDIAKCLEQGRVLEDSDSAK